ncbi:outer membrane protein assembly factor BamC [Franzmannia pantelleriensis]|uniref:Outer membrane protein assembly factor BamC n=1 Tax=Franzmannia pantelleriensis TaxID=48727 RepID=A0A1G9PIV1_9GAMM|nr:hypothetical protein [Halomonas pantelleriensis]SDL98065.1 outer membrane protein assembly factor BamC [Halomonas pantelleriensis]
MNPALKWMPLVVSIALVTAGCARDGYFHDRNIDYAEAEQGRPLVLPETRDQSRYRDIMPVPEARGEFVASDGRFRAPRPDAVARGGQRDFVERRESGSDRWLLVNAEAGDVWPRLEDFSRRQGLSVTENSPQRGVLATSEATFTLQPGVRSGATEVRCEQGGAIHTQCLDALNDFLTAESRTASASALATQRAQQQEESVRLERSDDSWQLLLAADMERTWAEMDYQLSRNFTSENRELLLESDAANRDFLLEYMTASERNRGVFSIVFSPDVRQTAQWLRLSLDQAPSGETRVRVINESDKELTADDTRELLDRVAALLR